MNEKQIKQDTKSEFSENICKKEESANVIENRLNADLEEKQADVPEFLRFKAEFLFLVKKYLCYRSDGNMWKIFEFLNKLDVINFNKILNYFEEQRDKAKNFQVKQDLAILYSEILEKRNTSIIESREKLYAKNMIVEKWWIINSKINWNNPANKIKSLESSNIELLYNWDWHSILLNFWDWEPQIFHVKTSNNSLVVMDEFNNPLKCNVELMWMDLTRENIWLWQERVINIKKYRVLIGNLFFVLKFND